MVGDIGIADVGSRIPDFGFRDGGGAGSGNGFRFSEFGTAVKFCRGFFDIATKWQVTCDEVRAGRAGGDTRVAG